MLFAFHFTLQILRIFLAFGGMSWWIKWVLPGYRISPLSLEKQLITLRNNIKKHYLLQDLKTKQNQNK